MPRPKDTDWGGRMPFGKALRKVLSVWAVVTVILVNGIQNPTYGKLSYSEGAWLYWSGWGMWTAFLIVILAMGGRHRIRQRRLRSSDPSAAATR